MGPVLTAAHNSLVQPVGSDGAGADLRAAEPRLVLTTVLGELIPYDATFPVPAASDKPWEFIRHWRHSPSPA
ncbi:hypothetical protein GCM10009734_31330 [Nonomuraea bangladeshensis]